MAYLTFKQKMQCRCCGILCTHTMLVNIKKCPITTYNSFISHNQGEYVNEHCFPAEKFEAKGLITKGCGMRHCINKKGQYPMMGDIVLKFNNRRFLGVVSPVNLCVQ